MKALYYLAQLDLEETLPNAGEDEVFELIGLLSSLAGMLAIIFIIVGGIRMAASGGNPEALKKARATIMYAVIGLFISISAVAIVSLITGKLTVF